MRLLIVIKFEEITSFKPKTIAPIEAGIKRQKEKLKASDLIDKLNLVTREILSGTRVIRAFNNEKYEENKFKNTNQELTNTNLFINLLGALIDTTINIIFYTFNRINRLHFFTPTISI